MKNNESAFPHEWRFSDGEVQRENGMSLRDWFAGRALTGLIAHPTTFGCTGDTTIAEMAYKLADAMLAERADKEKT